MHFPHLHRGFRGLDVIQLRQTRESEKVDWICSWLRDYHGAEPDIAQFSLRFPLELSTTAVGNTVVRGSLWLGRCIGGIVLHSRWSLLVPYCFTTPCDGDCQLGHLGFCAPGGRGTIRSHCLPDRQELTNHGIYRNDYAWSKRHRNHLDCDEPSDDGQHHPVSKDANPTQVYHEDYGCPLPRHGRICHSSGTSGNPTDRSRSRLRHMDDLAKPKTLTKSATCSNMRPRERR